MRSTSHLAARMIALVASLAAVVALVVLPCPMGAEACALAPATATGAMAHCPMAAANGGRPMECCAKGETPRSSNPATPAAPDSASRLQVQLQGKVLPVGAETTPSAPVELAAAERLAAIPVAIPAPPATPLYTLLSSLLS
jgi:hypothetical protein